MNTRRKRIWALGMAIALGATSLFDYQFFRNQDANADKTATVTQDKVVFAQGEGILDENGEVVDFSENSWDFTGRGRTENNDAYVLEEKYKPAIVDDAQENKYLESALALGKVDTTNVIRLIRGVKEQGTSGLEDTSSYQNYRSGAAFLKNPVQFGKNGEFSITYTFSMPEAVVNTTQANKEGKGEFFAREYGGDGIALVMTTQETDAVDAGSGMGYQGINNSLTIEADSFFNGAYCYINPSNNAYDLQNWGFDNQLYFRSNGKDGGSDDFKGAPYSNGYISNYQNPNHEERFDHFAITKDGDVKNHEKIHYINDEIDPTEMATGNNSNLYANLSGNIQRSSNQAYVSYDGLGKKSPATASTDSDCSTRFADKGVDDRLFTVWVDYDGATMKIYYENGALSTATKPSTPIITQPVSMDNFQGKAVYLGFTSAVGTSKANHTIHSLKVTVPEEVTAQASYQLKYWWKDPNSTTNEYIFKEETEIVTDNIGTKISADKVDSNYASKYESQGYTLSNAKEQELSVTLEKENETYIMNVYYDPEPTKYTTEYYLQQPDGTFKKQNTDTIVTENVYVGTSVTAQEKTYDGYTHVVIDGKSNEEDTVAPNGTTVLKVYYKQLASYKLNYYLGDGNGNYTLDDKTDEKKDVVGTTHTVTEVDPNYETKYPNYSVNKNKNEDYKVTLTEAGKTYEMNVYYDPKPQEKEEAYYLLNYHVKNDKGEYVLKESTKVATDKVGSIHTVEEVDPNYETKYPGYSVNKNKNEDYKVTLTEAGTTYQMNVYYDPQEAKYKLNYHLGDGNGTYTLDASTEAVTGIVGNTYTVTDVDPKYGTKYPNYSVNKNKNEEYEVKLTEAGKTYEMHVYYDPETIIPGVKLNYYKFNPNTEKYEYIESTKTESANVNDTKTVEDLDADYKQKYANDGYTYNSNKEETYSVNIESNDKVYEVDAYYDPTITKYTTEYYLQQPDGSYKKQEDDTIVTNNVYAGKNVTAQEKTYNNYTHVIIDDKSKEQATVKADGSTVLKVYYNLVEKPQEEAYYLLNYYVKNDKGEYELKDSTAKKTDAVGSNHTVTDVDPNYKTKYPNYTVNGNKNTEYTVILTKAGETYEMNVYYDPVLTEYKTEYYLEQPDGTFKKQDPDTIVTKDVHAGISVTAQEKTYNGYTHVTVAESKEKDTVAADGSTVLKVYYKLIAVTSAPAVVATPTPTPVVTATPVVTETPVPVVKVTPTPKAKVTKKPAQTQVDLDGDAPADSTKGSPKTPETGDHTNWKLPMVLMVFSAAIAGGLFVKLRKKEEKEDKEQ